MTNIDGAGLSLSAIIDAGSMGQVEMFQRALQAELGRGAGIPMGGMSTGATGAFGALSGFGQSFLSAEASYRNVLNRLQTDMFGGNSALAKELAITPGHVRPIVEANAARNIDAPKAEPGTNEIALDQGGDGGKLPAVAALERMARDSRETTRFMVDINKSMLNMGYYQTIGSIGLDVSKSIFNGLVRAQ